MCIKIKKSILERVSEREVERGGGRGREGERDISQTLLK